MEKWIGEPVKKCDLCKTQIIDEFVDGATKMGPWACLCLDCHKDYGVGLGTGRGQRYERIKEGSKSPPKWVKAEG